MAEKLKVKGIMTFKKNEKAPKFVLGSGVINIDEIKDFVDSMEVQEFVKEYQGKRQIPIQFLMNEEYGTVSVVVDTYKKNS
jgi:hypothetical protein